MGNITTAQVLFKGDFRNDVSPPKIRLTDLTDYTGVSFPNVVSKGIYKITAPNGAVFYKNTGWDTDSFASADSINWPLTDPGYNPIFSTNLPLDVNGNILKGNYTIEYKVSDENGAAVYLSQSFNYCHTIQDIAISQVVDCFSSQITSKDITNYTGAEGTYTISLSRQHVLYYPVALGLAPTTVTGDTIIVSPIYSQTWTTKITTTITYDFGNHFTIIDLLVGSKEIDVNCDFNLCQISCGVEQLNQRYVNAVAFSSKAVADSLFEDLTRIVQLMNLFQNAQKCGFVEDADSYLKEIYQVGQFTGNCNCADGDEPQLIIPINGGGGNSVIVEAGVGILVTSSTSQGTTTYTVQLSSAYQSKIDALNNVTFTTDFPGTVVWTSSTVGYLTTWKLNVNSPAPADGSITAAKLATGAVTTIKITDGAVTGAKIADFTITAGKYGALSIVGSTDINTGSIVTANLSDLSVTTAKINDLGVTTGKLADLSVTTGKLANNAVTTAKLALLSVDNTILALLSVATGNIQDLAVTGAKIANATITNTQIANATITSTQMANLSIATNALQDSAVSTVKLADGSVTTVKLAAAAVTTAKIANNAVTWGLLDTSIQVIREIYTVSFEATGLGTVSYTVPTNQAMNIQKVSAVVKTTINGANNGTIQVIDSIGAVLISTLTITAGSTTGTVFNGTGPYVPIITPGGSLQLTTAKVTAGGTCDVLIEYYPV